MYCKKCGTEQKEGQKFCPKCGEPFIIAEDNSNKGGNEDGFKKAKDNFVEKAGELSQKSKDFFENKVQPQIKEKVEEFKKTDWDEKKNKAIKISKDFLSDKDKMRKATIGIAIISVLWFFIFRGGFSASWYWWLFAIAFIVGAFYKIKAKDEADALMKARWTLILAAVLGVVLVFQSPSSSSFGGVDSDIDYKASNSEEEETLMKMTEIRGEISSILPTVEALYNAHQNYMLSGGRGSIQSSSPAWGKWQDCQSRINNLWDEYIRLAQRLDDNEEIIEEARESKRKMNQAFHDMFVPRY